MPSDVRLREVADTDVPVFFEQQNDPVASEMAAFPRRERAAHEAHWAKIRSDPDLCARTILEGDEVAGNIGSFERDGLRQVGYWLGRAFWGRGIATRALALFLAEVHTARPLYAYVVKHNVGSIRVLQKNGFVKLREETLPPDADGVAEVEFLMRLEAPAPR